MRIEMEDPEKKKELEEAQRKIIHESDLTKKERRQMEREKIRGMGMGARIEYIWTYYKPAIFGVVAAIVMIFVAKDIIENAKTETSLDIMTINAMVDDVEAAEQSVEKTLGIQDEKYKEVILETNMHTEENGTDLMTASQMAFVAKIQAASVDVLVMPETFYEAFDAEYYLADMKEILGEELYQSLGDAVDPYHVVTENKELRDLLGLPYDKVCLAVVVNSKQKENASTWIRSFL